MANSFFYCDHLGLNCVLLLEVNGEVVEPLSADVVPVDMVPSLLKLRSFPMLLVVSADNSIMNSKIFLWEDGHQSHMEDAITQNSQ